MKMLCINQKAPYNFIGLEDFILDKCSDEEELLMHERYHEGLKTGCIQYEIEVITPLHISAGKKESGKEKEDSEEESTREEELFKILLGNMYSGEYNSWPHKVQRFHIFFCVSDK